MLDTALNSSQLSWKELTLKRGDFLIRAGEVERSIYYIKSGALRAYTYAEEEEFTLRFGYGGSIITSLPSYFNGEPSETYIQAIRKTTLLKCSKTEFEVFLKSSENNLLAYKKLMEEQISSLLEREIDLMHQSPSQRLERVRKRSPQLFQEIPHKYIAAYLRMSAETLSRLLKS